MCLATWCLAMWCLKWCHRNSLGMGNLDQWCHMAPVIRIQCTRCIRLAARAHPMQHPGASCSASKVPRICTMLILCCKSGLVKWIIPQGSMLFDGFTMTSSVSVHFEKESWCCVRDFVITLLSALLRWNWGLDWQDGPVCDSAKWWTRVPHSGHDQCWKKTQIQLGPDGRLAWGARHSLHRHGQQLHGSWRAHWRSCVQRFATAFRFQRTGVHGVSQQSKHNYIYIHMCSWCNYSIIACVCSFYTAERWICILPFWHHWHHWHHYLRTDFETSWRSSGGLWCPCAV